MSTDEPTLYELQRLIERNHRENTADIHDLRRDLSTQMERFVLREVYQANHDAALFRIGQLEAETKSGKAGTRTAIYTAIGAVVAAIAMTILQVLTHGSIN